VKFEYSCTLIVVYIVIFIGGNSSLEPGRVIDYSLRLMSTLLYIKEDYVEQVVSGEDMHIQQRTLVVF
jgi:hypothetical protein